NEAVLKMLNEIGRPENVSSAIDKAKDRDSGFRLMGFGHRVYKNYDPRAALVRKMTHEVLGQLGVSDPLLEVAMKLEEAALKDDYFVQRKLYPNVDFYSGIIYKALGIPVEMFTVMFAIARTAGRVSHWLEQQNDPENRIGRPRQDYTGAADPDFVESGAPGAQGKSDGETPRSAGRFRLRRRPARLSSGFVAGDLVLRQQRAQLRGGGALHRPAVDRRQRRLPQYVGRQHGDVEAQVFGGEQPDRVVAFAFAVQPQVAAARLRRYPVVVQPARDRVRIVAVDMQGDRGIGIGGAFQHRTDQARLEIAEELQRAQRGLAAATDLGGLAATEEQALVFAQRVLDLAVARQRGVIKDAEPLRGLELGLVEVADAAFGHQPGGLVGQALAAFAGAGLRMGMRMGLGVLAGVRHRGSPGTTCADCTGGRVNAHQGASRLVCALRRCRTLPRPAARPGRGRVRVRSACVPRPRPSTIRPRRWP